MRSIREARNHVRGMMALMLAAACGLVWASTPGDPPPSGRDGTKVPFALTYVANMGVLVSSGETKVLVDALFDKPNPDYRAPSPETLDKIMKGEAPFDGVDLVLVTHDHPDHFDAGLAVRYMETFTEAVLLAPADAVEALRGAAKEWARLGPRVIAIDLKVGEKAIRDVKGIPVTACRTLHSGDRDSPMNLMYLFEVDGRRVWHEGDPNGRCEIFEAFGLKDARLDLAVVHFWYPLEPNCARFLQEDLKVGHIALSHLPIRLEGDAPSKIDMVRQYYQDLTLLLPGMPARVLQSGASGDAGAQELLEAVKSGDLDKVRQIAERNSGVVNVTNQNGETILFAAIMPGGGVEIVEYLISKGANVNQMNNFYMAPLHLACRRGLPLETIRLLVEHGADVNAVSKYQGRPLDIAYERGDGSVTAYLSAKGAVLTPLEFETVKLAAGLHRLAYPWGMRNNLVVSTGPDGALVLDTGFSTRALDAIRKIVAGFGQGEIRYVINTHSNMDHVAGNALAPSESAVIGLGKADSLVQQGQVTRSGRGRQGPGGKALPAPYLMRFNGQEIEIFPSPGLHSEEDILIYFTKAGVLCMGDLLLSQSCPAVRDAAAYLEFLDKVLDVFPPRTTFVSGHGGDLSVAGLKKYRVDMAEMAQLVKKEFAAGRTEEEMIRADLLKAFKAAYSHLDWLGPDSWIRTVVRGLQAGKR